MCEWEALHSYVRFIEKSKKRKNFILSGNSFYIASDGLYSIGRIMLIFNISLSLISNTSGIAQWGENLA